MKRGIILTSFFILAIAMVSAEVYVFEFDNLPETDPRPAARVIHTFEINKYYPAASEPDIGTSIMIHNVKSEATISRCQDANLSFRITNTGRNPQIYDFSAKDFAGTLHITPNLYLMPGEARIVNYRLVPDCSLSGEINPHIIVEARDSFEEAQIPVILRIEGIYIDASSCEYHFNSTICESDYYLRFNQNRVYNLDLSNWFFDPDGDKLEYGARENINLNIDIKGSKVSIRPVRNWHGTEQVVFYADDGKGGVASSARFYVHVIETKDSFFQRLFRFFF
jgi:hypothetical protein